jgi:hypothetical protein
MDKPRHPHVVRTWTVERTRIPIRNPQNNKPKQNRRQGHSPQPPGGSKPEHS